MTEILKSNLAIQDWPTQLAVFKAMYNTEDVHVKYLDDEYEEVGIENQQDLDYAYQIALNSNNALKLIIRNSRNELLGKQLLNIDLETIKFLKAKREQKQTVNEMGFTDAQIKWLENYLDSYKRTLYSEIELKIDTLMKKKMNLFDELDEYDSLDLKKKVNILFNLINESRIANRSLKAAYYEEELQSTQAFMAEFIKDFNMPDGSRCEPNVKFQKTWLIKNIGKLDWNSQNYQVKLMNINGNIKTELDFVNVDNTLINETASVSVDLIAPSKAGNYFSEWVLCCNGFQFGPRIWCSINVAGASSNPSIIDSDNDDEFVVIPACFDLSKKWVPETVVDRNEDEDTLSLKSDSTYKSTEQDVQNESLIKLEEELCVENRSDHSLEEVITREVKTNQLSSAFDMMKNAFSNLGRPSYVGSIDFISGNEERPKESQVDEMMRKLISMGFANRDQNRRLLNDYNLNLEKVIQHLVDDMDNNWAENR